jgi:hypothetical protein
VGAVDGGALLVGASGPASGSALQPATSTRVSSAAARVMEPVNLIE